MKDLIEEKLFERRRDLFTDLSAVFMDTTSLSFYGEGGESLGEHGYSKDYRPDLNQMILGLVVDGDGWPICTEMWPGNTADVTTLLPVVDRLRSRFHIGRVCVVADRGMISAETIAGLEAAQARIHPRRSRAHRRDRAKIVLANDEPVRAAADRAAERARRNCSSNRSRSRAVATSSAATRPRPRRIAPTARRSSPGSMRQLKKGDKALIGNSAYRRYLRKTAR